MYHSPFLRSGCCTAVSSEERACIWHIHSLLYGFIKKELSFPNTHVQIPEDLDAQSERKIVLSAFIARRACRMPADAFLGNAAENNRANLDRTLCLSLFISALLVERFEAKGGNRMITGRHQVSYRTS